MIIDIDYIPRDLVWKTVFVNGQPKAIYAFDKQCRDESCSLKMQKMLQDIPKNIFWTMNAGLHIKEPESKPAPHVKKHLTLIGFKLK